MVSGLMLGANKALSTDGQDFIADKDACGIVILLELIQHFLEGGSLRLGPAWSHLCRKVLVSMSSLAGAVQKIPSNIPLVFV